MHRFVPQLLIRPQHQLNAVQAPFPGTRASGRDNAGNTYIKQPAAFVREVAPPRLRKPPGGIIGRAGHLGVEPFLLSDDPRAQPMQGIGDDDGIGKAVGIDNRS